MKNYLKYIIVFLILYLVYKIYSIFNDQPIQLPKYEYPRIIWAYWDDVTKLPLIVKNILYARTIKLEDSVINKWDVKFLDKNTVCEYINKDEYPRNYSILGPAHQADWIRLYLLKHYGGIWLDSGIIINSVDAFNRLYHESVDYNSELTCFYLNSKTINNDPMTFIENWYILAPKNSRVINAWYDEYTLAIHMGFLSYRHDLTHKGVIADQVYLWGPQDTYLTMHAALLKIIQLNIVKDPNILLYKAEDTMFKLHEICDWDSNCIINKLKTDKSIKNIPYIKLRGTDRQDGNFTITL